MVYRLIISYTVTIIYINFIFVFFCVLFIQSHIIFDLAKSDSTDSNDLEPKVVNNKDALIGLANLEQCDELDDCDFDYFIRMRDK